MGSRRRCLHVVSQLGCGRWVQALMDWISILSWRNELPCIMYGHHFLALEEKQLDKQLSSRCIVGKK